MKTSLVSSLIFLIPYISFSQTLENKISGKVSDPSQQPIPGASIILTNIQEHSLNNGISDTTGNFTFQHLKDGRYLLQATFFGYGTYISDTIQLYRNIHQKINIVLIPKAQQLNEVSVTSDPSVIEIKPDRITFNVSKSPTATGMNIIELLQRTPGVSVGKDDAVSINGKGKAKIYINNKLINLSEQELTTLLRGMNSDNIESIDVIKNPSAKYDAAGGAGIINITLKRGKKEGWNAALTTGVNIGQTPKSNQSAAVSFAKNKLQFSGSYNINSGKYFDRQKFDRYQANQSFQQQADGTDKKTYQNIQASLNYQITPKTNLGTAFQGNLGNGRYNLLSETDIGSGGHNTPDSLLLSASDQTYNRKNFLYNLNITQRISDGHNISGDISYGKYNASSNSQLTNKYVTNNNQPLASYFFKSDAPMTVDIYSAKIDYSGNMKNGKLEGGAQWNMVKSNSAFHTTNQMAGQKTDSSSTNVKYNESIYAGYINYNFNIGKKVNVIAGIRGELTNTELDYASTAHRENNANTYNYFQLFPNFTFTYNVTDENILTLAYNRRIDRPAYHNMNPFEEKVDELISERGNPFLKPQYVNNIELGYILNQHLSVGLGYTTTSNLIIEFMDTVQRNKAFLTHINLPKQQAVNLNINGSFDILPFWTLTCNISGGYISYHASFRENNQVRQYGAFFQTNLQQSFRISETIRAEINGWYASPKIDGTWKNLSAGAFDIGIQKDILKKKGNIKVALVDVANTQKWRANNLNEILTFNIDSKKESRQLRLYFTYRIGGKPVETKSRNAGTQGATNRLKL
ncbi:TonB-dependent receptor [Chitinophaga varians]|uniref:TonB-dependent receptor n=1 Tax=Chitinophaga varians TaxID=2202339 RepID=A0A847S271_9BACT|nr:TonB-dependent receptor [Chitinophaga varians]NLR68484.1 TonB-dependent receptor [Chitinophaga varians]